MGNGDAHTRAIRLFRLRRSSIHADRHGRASDDHPVRSSYQCRPPGRGERPGRRERGRYADPDPDVQLPETHALPVTHAHVHVPAPDADADPDVHLPDTHADPVAVSFGPAVEPAADGCPLGLNPRPPPPPPPAPPPRC